MNGTDADAYHNPGAPIHIVNGAAGNREKNDGTIANYLSGVNARMMTQLVLTVFAFLFVPSRLFERTLSMVGDAQL